jgi:starch-binding outer membrane protein, SusD/RagB family
MLPIESNVTRRARGKRLSVLATLLLVQVFATGCDSLLEVKMPGQVAETELNNPALAATLVSAALGEFECSLSQYVATTGVLTGEYLVSGFLLASNIWGRRWRPNIIETAGGCGGGYGYYAPLQTARFTAVDASRRIEAFPDAEVPGKNTMLATLAAYAGYSYTLLGEGFCDMAIDGGPLKTRAEIFAEAEQWFSKALTLATAPGDTSIRNMALVGRARVRLNLGNRTGAATDAEQVTPIGFVRNASHSSTINRRNNRVFTANLRDRDISVGPTYRNLTVGGVADTRVRATFANRNGQDGVTPQWDQAKFTALNSPIPIASWAEAQLIIAEARGGQAAFDAINRLRTRAGLPLLAAGTSVDLPMILEERRRQLFSEGQRYNDMLRHNIPFPSGVDHKGQLFGDVTCVPLPTVETLNNPNIRR